MKAKILFLDVETSTILGDVWGAHDVDVLRIVRDWYMLGFSCKWLNKKGNVYTLSSFKGYKKPKCACEKQNDYNLMKKLWYYLNEADIVVAHNGDKFDIRKINARFIQLGLPIPSPYKQVDTLKEARKYFKFTSNRLDALGEALNVGRKIKHSGVDLWFGCQSGDKKSWKTMEKYNRQDVILLENVYKKLLPYMKNHPNLNMYTGDTYSCTNCSSSNIQKRGIIHTNTSSYQRYVCNDCGKWSRSRKQINTTKPELV